MGLADDPEGFGGVEKIVVGSIIVELLVLVLLVVLVTETSISRLVAGFRSRMHHLGR